MQVQWKTKRPYVFLLLLLLLLLLQRSCSNCPDVHAHADLELW